MSITIREENESDILEIYKVTEEAFKDVELSDKTEPLIVSALRKAGKLTVSLVDCAKQGS
jgi:putative acetyltransferase